MKTLFLYFVLMGGFLFISSCEQEDDGPVPCYLARVYWFGPDAHEWPVEEVVVGVKKNRRGNVTGVHIYTEAEAKAMVACPGSATNSKEAYWILVSMQLSGIEYTGDSETDDALEFLHSWFWIFGKVDSCSDWVEITDNQFEDALATIQLWTSENGCPWLPL